MEKALPCLCLPSLAGNKGGRWEIASLVTAQPATAGEHVGKKCQIIFLQCLSAHDVDGIPISNASTFGDVYSDQRVEIQRILVKSTEQSHW